MNESPETRFGYNDASKARDIVCETLRGHGMNPDSVKDGIILGSGLGPFAEQHMEKGGTEISFDKIFTQLGIPLLESQVSGHARELIISPLKDDPYKDRLVIAQPGREHPYEGISTKRATFWLRVMQLLGVETLFNSNAGGIITPKTLPTVPSLMIVHSARDYSEDNNPLVGPDIPEFGPRFPHNGNLFPEVDRKLVIWKARELEIPISEGMLVRMPGPAYESAETIRWLRGQLKQIWDEGFEDNDPNFMGRPIGIVGMSSTYEHEVAQHASPIQNSAEKHPNRAFGRGRVHVSVSTNYGAGLGPKGPGAFPSHPEVKANAALVEDYFGRLAHSTIAQWQIYARNPQ